MIATPRLSVFGVALVALCGCSGSRPDAGGQFAFDVEGAHYQILSAREPSGGGANYLVCREDGRTVLRAIDGDQDGVIEAVLTGAISVEEANRIYSMGLSAATSGGKVDRRDAPRLFSIEDRGQSYSVRSVTEGPGAPYNTFSVTDSDGSRRAVATDEGADGILDEVVEGTSPLEAVQSLYAHTINRGILLGRIHRESGRVIVQPDGV